MSAGRFCPPGVLRARSINRRQFFSLNYYAFKMPENQFPPVMMPGAGYGFRCRPAVLFRCSQKYSPSSGDGIVLRRAAVLLWAGQRYCSAPGSGIALRRAAVLFCAGQRYCYGPGSGIVLRRAAVLLCAGQRYCSAPGSGIAPSCSAECPEHV